MRQCNRTRRVSSSSSSSSHVLSADPTMQKKTSHSSTGEAMFSLPLTIKFIATTIFLSSMAAFSMGCIARIILLSEFDVLPLTLIRQEHGSTTSSAGVATTVLSTTNAPTQLPAPTVIPGKDVPYTLYTSKTFRIEGSATSHTLHIDRRSEATKVLSKLNQDLVGGYVEETEEDAVQNVSTFDASMFIHDDEEENEKAPINDYSHNDDSDGLHLPAGQHLLVDIKDVDSEFLNSEERLAFAMVELINESKLTLLSYHCHSLVPIGVSCAGVLLESHVAFHTWPNEGVITMDLFTCGGNPLIPVLSDIKRLFGVRRTPAEGESEEDTPEPTLLWSHKLRGFREGFAPGYDRERNPLDQDLGRYVLGKLDFDLKDQVVSAKTDFQTVDVYDVMYPSSRNWRSYLKSSSEDGSYESEHPENFGPDRVLFLDGVIQSTLYGDAPYHESIVHPAMITHEQPKRVAIIGGGEGATLREVLKHKTVEEAVMIEIDEGVVELSRQHLPQWQDCSSISHHEKSADWCFDDERVTARFEDAMAYFIDHFADDNEIVESKYDIIVMDALDPNDDIPFAVELYTSDTYIKSLYNALTKDGILVVQVGEVPSNNDPADETGRFANRAIMKDKLGEVGFQSIHVYEEAHSRFLAPWSTLVAFKDIKTRKNWYRNAAEVELQLKKRILSNKQGGSSLRYFDGATLSSYQLPSSAFATVHCRQEDAPEDCGKSNLIRKNTVFANETNTTSSKTAGAAYNPVSERHATESLHSRENALHSLFGLKEQLLN